MNPGDLVKLQLAYISTSFRDDDMKPWRDESKVYANEVMIFLGDCISSWGTRWVRVFHCPSARIGHVRLEHITKVKP